MTRRRRKITSLVLAGSMIAGGGLAIGAADALAHDSKRAPSAAQKAAKAANGVIARAVQSTLDITTADLRAAKKAGTSLTALAKSKGVSRDTLVDAISTAIASTPRGAKLTAAQRTTMAERIADRTPRSKPARGGERAQIRSAVQQAITSTLGVSVAELRSARRAGTSPAELANTKGVSRDTLVSAVAAALKASKPAKAPALTDAQLTTRAERIVDNARPGHGPRGQRGGHR